MSVAVTDLSVFATLRLVLTPFLPAWPCFGTISIAFTRKPNIDFALQVCDLSKSFYWAPLFPLTHFFFLNYTLKISSSSSSSSFFFFFLIRLSNSTLWIFQWSPIGSPIFSRTFFHNILYGREKLSCKSCPMILSTLMAFEKLNQKECYTLDLFLFF